MHTPFLIPETDGRDRHFWELLIAGNIAFLLSRVTHSFPFPFDCKRYISKYWALWVYCTEPELFVFEKWLNKMAEKHGGVKLLGTHRVPVDRLKLFMDDGWFKMTFKNATTEFLNKHNNAGICKKRS